MVNERIVVGNKVGESLRPTRSCGMSIRPHKPWYELQILFLVQ